MWYPAMGIKTKHNKKGIEDAVLNFKSILCPLCPNPTRKTSLNMSAMLRSSTCVMSHLAISDDLGAWP